MLFDMDRSQREIKMKTNSMNFQSVKPLNVWLNFLSGNLLPMTSDDSSYPIFWQIYSVLLWSLSLTEICVLILGCMFVPKETAMKDGIIGIVTNIEVIFMVVGIYTRKRLLRQMIKNLNDILQTEDEIMRNIVMTTLKSIETPLKFCWIVKVISITLWTGSPFLLIFQKNVFFYVDYRMPVAYAKEPFSTTVFMIGSLIIITSGINSFTKKIAVDSYMMHLILLTTAQYRYIALKLSMIFQGKSSHDDKSSDEKKDHLMDHCAEESIKALCRHHNNVIQITFMLRNLLSLNFSVICVTSILRYSFIAILAFAIPSMLLLEKVVIVMYTLSGIMQLYLLCSCVQQLLDAAVEITDNAFHDEWYRYGRVIKNIFIMIIMANNLECKLSTFRSYNLSLPSLMTILNSSYSFALLLLRMN